MIIVVPKDRNNVHILAQKLKYFFNFSKKESNLCHDICY